jgi:hypothetical protein
VSESPSAAGGAGQRAERRRVRSDVTDRAVIEYLPAAARDWRLSRLNEDLGNAFGRVRVGGHGAVVGHAGSVTLRTDILRWARPPPGRFVQRSVEHGLAHWWRGSIRDVHYSFAQLKAACAAVGQATAEERRRTLATRGEQESGPAALPYGGTLGRGSAPASVRCRSRHGCGND